MITTIQPGKKLKKSIEDYNGSHSNEARIDNEHFLRNTVNHLETTKDVKIPNPCAIILHHIYQNMID